MKKKNDDMLSKRIRERLKDFEQPVPDHIWSAIEEDLIPTASISRTKILWKRLSVAASFLVILSLGTVFFLHRSIREQKIVENNIEIQNIESNPSLLAEQNTQEDLLQKVADAQTVIKPAPQITSLSEHSQKTEIPVIEPEETTLKTKSETIPETTENTAEKEPNQPAPQEKKSSDFYKDATADNNLWHDTSRKKKKNNGISYALAMGNAGNFESGNNSSHYNEEKMSAPNFNYSGSSPLTSIDLANQSDVYSTTKVDETLPTDYSYDLPVSVGFTVRKYFSDVFALETGLVYTYLASKGKVVSTTPITNNTSLNYLGIPVKAVYSLYDKKRFSVYATAGGMVEKSISGKFKKTINNKVESGNLNVKELQFSVLGSVGINFQLLGHFGLFIEPGVAYYFDDGNDVMTIRKNQAFNFNLQGGLRLTY
ncbi:MAG: PorT family protein [Dysgonamonadaceae bacterium]|jgi:hypothetical protein|nr:PorT family protein [Dysgonamonadaceae bacterium]